MRLTTTTLSEWHTKALSEITEINASNKEISHIDNISACTQLRKVNLSNNDLRGDDSIAGLCQLKDITWLNLSRNKFKDCGGLQHFKALRVLNISHNNMTCISDHIATLSNLKALVLNHNKIKEAHNLSDLASLNTIGELLLLYALSNLAVVLSHNEIESFPAIPKLVNLTKLSVAHNKLEEVPDLTSNMSLKEVRLNDNNIRKIPDAVRHCSALEILDFGNNLLKEWSHVAALGSLLKLNNLNLKGNPVTEKKNYKEKILELVPSLRILDGERFDEKFLERKRKQQENPKLVEKKERLKKIKKTKEEQKASGEEEVVVKKLRHKKLKALAKNEDEEKPSVDNVTKRKRIDKEDVAKATKQKKLKKDVVATDGASAAIKQEKKSKSKINITDSTSSVIEKGKRKRQVDENSTEGKKKVKQQKAAKPEGDVEKTAEIKQQITKTKAKAKKKDSTEEPKTKKSDVDRFFAENTNNTEPKASELKPVLEPVTAPTQVKTGVVAVVNKHKKKSPAKKSGVDIVALLEDSSQIDADATGTGLGVGGWDD
ncbi:hypothetical protein DFQ28_000645 [Apophysomyces sp. BC1034]|nr:hypothetical protein DFQ30_000681 [Apophysomyces sp. BC1015]KAG0178232.1 hypothetical protein DFQ29_003758 [Apophysomyces sp. BC1021]KAG0191250.1 hypothetical protein DFQ28_000645 [Apophysomyces sp. BC1034]